MFESLVHLQPLELRLFAAGDDIHAVAASQAMVEDAQQAVGVRWIIPSKLQPAIPPGVQAPIAEEQESTSLLFLEGDPIARICPAMSNGQRGPGRGMLFGHVESTDIEDPDVTLL